MNRFKGSEPANCFDFLINTCKCMYPFIDMMIIKVKFNQITSSLFKTQIEEAL